MVKNRAICRSRIGISPSQEGFTLVATILVISLLTVLVVAATIVAQIEEQAAYNASRQEIARQNALFGLNEALNQLQTAAGPDRRATARADIITANMTGSQMTGPSNLGYTANTPAVEAGQSFWTGVWKNTSNDYSGAAGNGFTTNPDPAPGQNPGPGGSFLYYDYTPDGNLNSTSATAAMSPGTIPSRDQLYNNKNVSWLVSWPYATGVNPPDPTKTLAAQLPTTILPTRGGNVTLTSSAGNPAPTTSNLVTIVTGLNIITNQNYGNISSGNGKVNYIDVPKVPILENQPGTAPGTAQVAVGTFAYWIADEGIKAKTNLQDPYLGTSPSSAPGVAASQAHFQIAQGSASSQALALNSSSYPAALNSPSLVDVRPETSGGQPLPPLIVPSLASMAFTDSAQTWQDFATEPNSYSPDFTVSSYGVLADNFNGGLRKDLTAALENSTLYQKVFGDGPGNADSVRKLYSVNNISGQSYIPDIGNNAYNKGSAAIVLDGLRFDSLFYYYNIYHASMPSPVSTMTSANPNGGIGSAFSSECGSGSTIPKITARVYEEVDPTQNKTVDMDGISPQRVFWNYNIAVNLNYVGPASPASLGYCYDFIFGESPVIVLYNPFDVNVVQPVNSYVGVNGNVGTFGSAGSVGPPVTTPPDTMTIGNDFPSATFPANGNGKAYIVFPDPNIQTDLDPVPFLPGELRAYGLANNILTASQPYADIANPTSACAIPASPNFTQFKTAGLNKLVSKNMSDQNFQEEEITTNQIILKNPGADVGLSITGSERIGGNLIYTTRYGYNLWPYKTSTGSIASGDTNLPNLPWPGSTTTVICPIPPYVTPHSPVSSPVTGLSNYVLTSLEQHMPGTNSATFLSWKGPLSGSSTSTGQFAEGLPGFAAGGPLINPLDTDLNMYIDDYANSGRLVGAAMNSSYDFQCDPNTNTSMIDTGWLPDSVGKSASNTQQIVYDLPRQPLISLGQFKNMYCHYASSGTYPILGFSFYPIGGSYQAGLPTNVAFAVASALNGTYGTPAALLLDDNFLGNEALFDGYFLSTVPPHGLADSGNWQLQGSSISPFTNLQSYIESSLPLPNSRLVYYNRLQSTTAPFNGNPPADNSTAPNYLDLQCPNNPTANVRKPAANLLLNGAFNINSTSVPAWTALLTSTAAKNSNLMALFTASSTGSVTKSTFTMGPTDTPFLNFSLPYGVSTWNGSANNNVPFFGLVDLNTTTVNSLASAIVAQVKQRGPFLSIGDFLNHRLTAGASALSTSGALQAAIDSLSINGNVTSQVGLANSTALTANASKVYNTATPVFPSGFTKTVLPTTPAASATGIAGTLLQNDLVQVIAPVISARSDTFTIRVYGQALSPAGSSEAEAYCEAVVQRLPEYVYSTENGITDSSGKANYAYDNPSQTTNNNESINGSGVTVAGLTSENSAFGRRFKIISLRWLNKNEI